MTGPRPDAQLRAVVVERTNRLSLEFVRFCLYGAVILHFAVVGLLGYWIYVHIGPGLFFGYGVIVTVAWVTWLRAVEFHRAFPGAEDQMQVRSDGPARLRRGE